MINTIDHIINIDLATIINRNQSINIKKNDNNSHKFIINIFNNLVAYDLTGTTSRIYFQKADNTKVFLDCVLDDALTGNISCLLTTQVVSYSGLVGSEITIYGSAGEILTSVTFNFIVLNVIRDDLAIESTSEFTALTDALAVVTNIENKLDITEFTIFKDATVTSLANNVQQVSKNTADVNTGILGKKYRKPIMTFIDDDGRSDVLTKWKPIMEEKNIPLTIPLVTSFIGADGYMTLAEIKSLVPLGLETASHTNTHIESALATETELITDYGIAKQYLIDNGLENDFLVYPGGGTGILPRKIARQYYKCAVDVEGGINLPPLKTYGMGRTVLGVNDLVYYKSKVDEAVASNGWLIWMSHSQDPTLDATQLQYIRDLIDYARSLGVEVVNLKKGFEMVGNIIDTGDYVSKSIGLEYTMLDCDGIMYSKSNLSVSKLSVIDAYTFSSVPSDFEIGRITITLISESGKTGFPKNSSGILFTNNVASSTYPYQEYHCTGSGKTFKRAWSGTVWTTFIEYAEVISFTKSVGGTVPANSTVNVAITGAMASTDTFVGNPPALLEAGIMYCTMINGTVGSLRLCNVTATEIIVASKTWNFTLTKN